MKGKKQAESSVSSSLSKDKDEDNQASTPSSDLMKILSKNGKVMGMICNMNLMDVPIQVVDILFRMDRREQTKKGWFGCGQRVTSEKNYWVVLRLRHHTSTSSVGAEAKLDLHQHNKGLPLSLD